MPLKDCRELDPEYVSGCCGHGFELYSQLFLLTYPEQIKAYDVLSFVFILITHALQKLLTLTKI